MVITEEELDALQGLPLGAQVLYLREIRRHMDYATGVTGIIRRISWDGLREVLEVEPRPGIARSLPSKQQVRRLAEWLERVGLVRNISDMTGKQLIFRLPLAVTDKNVQKKADTNPTQTRHSKADTNPTQLDANGGEVFGDSDCEYSADHAAPLNPEKPTHIRYPLSGDSDDDDAGVGACAFGEGDPAAQPADSQNEGPAAAVALFRGLLGEDAMPTRQLMEACGVVAAVAQVRPVTELELKAAIQTARRRGVVNIAPYVARIVENASMAPRVGHLEVSSGGRRAEDAAMAYLQGVFGDCA
ncbi:hypothetical protein [Chromobacterium subtsugae]|uniref:hypothetical protein n=1 Tax=Chromobacterium subtsugae TaxID=251747 RepID=UPI00069B40FE|nr:hypothetical protein [Chromobacterium subtsugae]